MKKKIQKLQEMHQKLTAQAEKQDKQARSTRGHAGELFINSAKHKRAQASGVQMAIDLLMEGK